MNGEFKMKYLLFDMSAVEKIVEKRELQSREFPLGSDFLDCILQKGTLPQIDGIFVKIIKEKGIIMSGGRFDGNIIVYDLQQSGLLEKEKNPDDLLLIFQKTLRTAIKTWNKYPFSSAERVHETKSIVFPFAYSDRRRVVIERSALVSRLEKRGIKWALLAYKYGREDAPKYEETAELSVLREAGEQYIDLANEIRTFFNASGVSQSQNNTKSLPIIHQKTTSSVSDGGFRYLSFEQQQLKLTETQKDVVFNPEVCKPIRIDGPAGTGKTASMILRAYKLLSDARANNKEFHIIFFSHSESTDYQNKTAFGFLDDSEYYLSGTNRQKIEFTSLFKYCIKSSGATASSIIEDDADEAKQSQRIYIEDAFDTVYKAKYRSYRALLSEEMRNLFDRIDVNKGILISMLQHEFAIQIKGRTNCTIEEYCNLAPIHNALPAKSKREKEFVFAIFIEYQRMLQLSNVFDCDDITIQALSQFNAPFWRRRRNSDGYDYIFADEMHLFNINEQHIFHFLTKNVEQREIPICFALDYGQAIGDRGNVSQDYIEKTFSEASKTNYKTVFRSSQSITDFCASISASGALMFQSDYRDPYSTPSSAFTQKEEMMCKIPRLYMYANDEEMLKSLKQHIDQIKKDIQCANKDIAIITFDDKYLWKENVEKIKTIIGQDILVLKDRYSYAKTTRFPKDSIILSSTYNVNGLEFAGVILVGVDDGRVPKTNNVGDVSENYIKFIAFNQLYLSASRAKYRLDILGNEMHGISPCLKYSIENQCLKITQ